MRETRPDPVWMQKIKKGMKVFDFPSRIPTDGFNEIHDLLHTIKDRPKSENIIIGIDGLDGVGKSYLAKELSEGLDAKMIELDEFLIKQQGIYVDSLRLDDLEKEIAQRKCSVIVEGVCLLDAMEKVGQQLTILIYIKKVADYGIWHDKETCDPTDGAEDVINRKELGLQRFIELQLEEGHELSADEQNPSLSTLTKELIRYHDQYRPSLRADYIFNRKV